MKRNPAPSGAIWTVRESRRSGGPASTVNRGVKRVNAFSPARTDARMVTGCPNGTRTSPGTTCTSINDGKIAIHAVSAARPSIGAASVMAMARLNRPAHATPKARRSCPAGTMTAGSRDSRRRTAAATTSSRKSRGNSLLPGSTATALTSTSSNGATSGRCAARSSTKRAVCRSLGARPRRQAVTTNAPSAISTARTARRDRSPSGSEIRAATAAVARNPAAATADVRPNARSTASTRHRRRTARRSERRRSCGVTRDLQPILQ